MDEPPLIKTILHQLQLHNASHAHTQLKVYLVLTKIDKVVEEDIQAKILDRLVAGLQADGERDPARRACCLRTPHSRLAALCLPCWNPPASPSAASGCNGFCTESWTACQAIFLLAISYDFSAVPAGHRPPATCTSRPVLN